MKLGTKAALTGVAALVAAVALVGIGTPRIASAVAAKEKLPVIIKRECSEPDANGVKTCTLTYEGGITQRIKIKDGQISDDQG